MTQNNSNSKFEHAAPFSEQAIQTLRQVAALPPPEGLEDRVHQRLAAIQAVQISKSTRPGTLLSIWRLWMPMQRLQFAGAALLVVAVGASSWTVYQGKSKPGQGSHSGAQPASSPLQTGFGPASSERRPATLTPIKVPPPAVAQKKPSATHLVKPNPLHKSAAKPAADDAPVQPQR